MASVLFTSGWRQKGEEGRKVLTACLQRISGEFKLNFQEYLLVIEFYYILIAPVDYPRLDNSQVNKTTNNLEIN